MKRVVGSLLLVLVVVLAGCTAATPAAPVATQAPAEAAATEAPAAEATEAPAEEAAAESSETPAEAVGEVVLEEVNPLELSGDIITAGSSTVYPLSEVMAERFTDEGFAGNITIDSVGTGGGFERFCVAGESDIANASRPINEKETANCAAIGRTPIEFRVGTDALAVVINPANEFLTDVTIEQLAAIFSADATNWSDVDPSWPAEPILRFSPGTDSGTFDYFVEAVMDVAYGEEGRAKLLDAANLQLSEDDNVLVQGVEGDVNAIGYFGFAYYEENSDLLGIVNINGVEAGAASVDDGSYPLARPLFIYSDATILNEKPQVAGFVNFYLSFVNEEVVGAGYLPASEDALNVSKQALVEALGQ